MKKLAVVISDDLGIHARPASELVKEAKKYQSIIKIKKGEKEVVATQLIMLMGLGVKKGEAVEFTIEGADEEIAYHAIMRFIEANL